METFTNKTSLLAEIFHGKGIARVKFFAVLKIIIQRSMDSVLPSFEGLPFPDIASVPSVALQRGSRLLTRSFARFFSILFAILSRLLIGLLNPIVPPLV